MIEVAELVALVTADARDFNRAMDEVEGRTKSVGKAAGLAGLAIAGGLAFGLDKSVEAAVHGQESTAKLDAAYKAANVPIGQFVEQINGAEEAGRRLGFANDDTRGSLATLTTATHDGAASLRDLSVAEDLARFKHESLQAASDMLAKAMTGSARAAKALGIPIIQVNDHVDALGAKSTYASTKAYALAYAHAQLQDKLEASRDIIAKVAAATQGQADAFAGSAAGGAAQFHAQMNDLGETLGTLLLPAITQVTAALSTAAEFLSEHKTLAEILVVALGGLAFAMLAVSVATSIAAAASAVFAAATAPITIPILAVIAAIALLGVGIYELVTHWHAVEATMKAVWSWVADVFIGMWHEVTGAVSATFNWIKNNWPLLLGVLTGPIGLAAEFIITHWNAIKTGAMNAFNDTLAFIKTIPGLIIDVFKDAGTWLEDAGKNIIEGLVNGIKGAVGDVKSTLGDLTSKLTSWKGPPEKDATILTPAGASLMDGFISGIQSKVPDLKGMLGGIAPAMSAQLSATAIAPSAADAGGGQQLHVHFDGSTVVASDRAQLRQFAVALSELLPQVAPA
jgi:hypothetical protein